MSSEFEKEGEFIRRKLRKGQRKLEERKKKEKTTDATKCVPNRAHTQGAPSLQERGVEGGESVKDIASRT